MPAMQLNDNYSVNEPENPKLLNDGFHGAAETRQQSKC